MFRSVLACAALAAALTASLGAQGAVTRYVRYAGADGRAVFGILDGDTVHELAGDDLDGSGDLSAWSGYLDESHRPHARGGSPCPGFRHTAANAGAWADGGRGI